jgi:hypothetical protein
MRTDGLHAGRRARLAHGLLVALLLLVTSASLWHEYALALHQTDDTCDVCLTAHGASALSAAAVVVTPVVQRTAATILAPLSPSSALPAQYRARAPPV